MRLCLLLLAALVLAGPSPSAADEAVWELLRAGGQVILMRHAVTTPGVGDPAGFRLEDCRPSATSPTRDARTRAASGPRSGRAAFRSAACSRARGALPETAGWPGTAEPWPPLSNLSTNAPARRNGCARCAGGGRGHRRQRRARHTRLRRPSPHGHPTGPREPSSSPPTPPAARTGRPPHP